MSEAAPSARSRPARAVVAAVALETLLALVVGVAYLGERGIWLDEAFTWSTVDRPFPDLLRLLVTREGFQILHSLMLWPLNQISSSPEMLRLPSALAFAAAVPAVWLAGRRLFDERAGLCAGLLLSVNGLAIYYAQEARSYTLTMMLCAYAAAFLAGEVTEPTRTGRWLWMAASVLAVYAHGHAVLAIGAQLGSLLLLPAGPRRRRLISGAVRIGLLAAPAAVLPVLHAARADGGAWLERPSIATIKELIWLDSGRTRAALPVYALGGALALFAAIGTWRRAGRSYEAWRYALLIAWLFVPVVVALGVSVLDPMWHYRYSIPGLGALVILVGFGVTRLDRRVTAAIVIVVLVAHGARVTRHWAGGETVVAADAWDDFEEIVDEVDRDLQAGDGVVFLTERARFPFEYAAQGTHIADKAVPLYPPAPWGEYRTGDQPPDASMPDDAQAEELLSSGPSRVWIVEAHHERGIADAYVNRLLPAYRVESHVWFAGLEELRLLVRR